MAPDLDGFDAWRAVAAHPGVFAPLKAEATKSARAFFVKFFKAQTSVAALRASHDALGARLFGLIVDGMKDSELRSLVGRVDRYHPDQRRADPQWRRARLRDLAGGAAEPVEKAQARRAPVRKNAGKTAPLAAGPRRRSSAGAVRKN